MAVTTSTLVPALLAVLVLSAGAFVLSILLGGHDARGTSPSAPAFTISGALDVPLTPGVGGPLDLTLTNPHDQHMSVTALSARVIAVDAPGSDGDRPCTPADFVVDEFSGAYPLGLPESATRSLNELGVTPAQMPVLRMLDTDVDQDGCKNAALTLAYTGTGEETR